MSGRLKSIRALRWQAQRVYRAAPYSATSQSLDHERSCDRGLRHWRPGVRRSCGAHGPGPRMLEHVCALAYGFARARCDGCGYDYLVAFSCKGRRAVGHVSPGDQTRRDGHPQVQAGGGCRYHAALGYGKLVPEQKHVYESKNNTGSRHNLNDSFTAAQSLHQQSPWPTSRSQACCAGPMLLVCQARRQSRCPQTFPECLCFARQR